MAAKVRNGKEKAKVTELMSVIQAAFYSYWHVRLRFLCAFAFLLQLLLIILSRFLLTNEYFIFCRLRFPSGIFLQS